MKELVNLLQQNNIEYINSSYADKKSIIIRKNGYQIEIYYKNGFVSDLHKIPYTWGIMGSTSISEIIYHLEHYLKIKIIGYQLSLL